MVMNTMKKMRQRGNWSGQGWREEWLYKTGWSENKNFTAR